MNDAPERILHIRQTQFSIARFYGGCTFKGHHYVYNPQDDSLTRYDIFQAEAKKRREEKAAERKAKRGEKGETQQEIGL